MLILLLQATRSTGEQILYGILLVIIYSTVIDKCLMMGTAKMQLKVVSDKIEEIRSAIITDIDRGVTMLKSETGYMGQHTQMAAYRSLHAGIDEDGEGDSRSGRERICHYKSCQ